MSSYVGSETFTQVIRSRVSQAGNVLSVHALCLPCIGNAVSEQQNGGLSKLTDKPYLKGPVGRQKEVGGPPKHHQITSFCYL